MISVWSSDTKDIKASYRPLKGERKTDVLIIGGGMAGILTAYRLKSAGVHCIVAEAKTVGSGVTQNTTAKITAQHGLIYADLIKRLGTEKAKMYYAANTKAVEAYRALAEKYPCAFEDKTAYVYSINDHRKIEREAAAYHALGLHADIKAGLPLPFSVAGSVYMENQAQFNPLKLLYSLAAQLNIYENTFVHKVDAHTKNGTAAYTNEGCITAKNVIFATHFPLVNIPGLYFMKLYQHRSYVLALEGAPLIDGMYVDEREDGHSFRTYKDLLLIGGGDHKTGKHGGGYLELQRLAKKAYPNATQVYHWATQDCMTLDGMPYIGYHRAVTKNMFTATGFNKWGMTSSMVAADILTDLILHGKSELSELYSPMRSMLSKQLFINIGSSLGNFLSIGGPRCPHMGCMLRLNKTENTWDCACHGSRFSHDGHVVDNPAKRGIHQNGQAEQ